MAEAKVLKLGDPCTACGGEYRKAKKATPAEYHKAFYGPDAPGLPAGYDTMNPDHVADHGELYVCHDCGHQTRFKKDAA